MATLIAVNSKTLDEGQRKWATYEAELYGLKRGVEKFGTFITTATAGFPTSGEKFKAKIGFLSDSTTAIGQWKSLTLPIGQIDFLSAKARRFYSWADECAGTIYWPLSISHMSGDDISLPHMLTHLGDLAKQRQAELHQSAVEFITFPMFLHSYHNGHKKGGEKGIEELGFSYNSLQLSADDVSEMNRAYLADNDEYNAVPLSTIYRIIALNDTDDIHKDIIKKVEAWRGTMFFPYTLPNTEHPLLYTPAYQQILRWPDEDQKRDTADLTRSLVTVVPSIAMVKVTNVEAIIEDDEMEEGHYMTHDLKQDILLLSHNCAQHPSLAQTIKNVASVAWFIDMKTRIPEYFNSCTICLPRRTAHRTVGVSIMAARRYKAIQIDH